MFPARLALLLGLVAASFHAHAAVFENRRKLTTELVRRHAEGQALTVEEKAVLDALPKIGFAACPNGTGVTGTLIRRPDNGRDAVLVSKHSFIDNGKPNCDLTRVRFYPNINLYDGLDVAGFIRISVDTDGNIPDNAGVNDDINNDFLIFNLSGSISNDAIPNGQPRGYMEVLPKTSSPSTVTIIGKNNIFNGYSATYEFCNAIRDEIDSSVYLFHDCSTSFGSSSSALTVLHDGELKLVGLHKGAFKTQMEIDTDIEHMRELPTNIRELNQAVSSEQIMKALLD